MHFKHDTITRKTNYSVLFLFLLLIHAFGNGAQLNERRSLIDLSWWEKYVRQVTKAFMMNYSTLFILTWHHALHYMQVCACPCAINFSRGFWYGGPFTFEGTKLLTALISAIKGYKFHAHISFLSKVILIHVHVCANST